MFIKFSTISILMAIVVSLSGIGGGVAGHQYFMLQVQKNEALNRRTLDESSLTFMKAVGSENLLMDKELAHLMDEELAHRKTIIERVDSNAAAIIAELEIRAIIDLIAWGMVFVISGWALSLNERKRMAREKIK